MFFTFPYSDQPSSFSPHHPPPILAPSSVPCSAPRRPLDLDKHINHNSSASYHREYSPDYNSVEAKRSRHLKQDPAAPHSRSKYPDHCLVAEGGHSRHADPYPEHLLPSKSKHGNRYPEYEPTETGRARGPGGEDTDSVVRRKERPARPPPPQIITERDTARDRDRDKGRDVEWERHMGKDQRREREQDLRGEAARGRHKERSRDKTLSGDTPREKDRQRQKDKDRQRTRTKSREREIDEDYLELGHSGDCLKVSRASWEKEEDDGERERRAKGRQRVHSGPDEVFEESRSNKGKGDAMVFWDPQQEEGPGRQRNHTFSNGETGTTLSPPLGPVGVFVWCAGTAFSLWCVDHKQNTIINEDTNFLMRTMIWILMV